MCSTAISKPTHLVKCIFFFLAPLCRRLILLFPLAAAPTTSLQPSLLLLVVIPSEDGGKQSKHLKSFGVRTRSAEELQENIIDQAAGARMDLSTVLQLDSVEHSPINIGFGRISPQSPQSFSEMFLCDDGCDK